MAGFWDDLWEYSNPGTVLDKLTGVEAADTAAEAQMAASRSGQESQERMFNRSMETQKPWLEAGGRGLSQLEAGIGSGRFDVEPGQFEDMQFDFEADPGYQFRLSESLGAIDAASAASGGFFSGARGQALTDRASNMASQEYGQAYNRFAQDRNFQYGKFGDDFNRERSSKVDQYNRLASLAGIGQQTASEVGSRQMQQGGNLANLAFQRGNIGAERAMAQYEGQRNLLNTGIMAGGAILASDINIKENIKPVGKENGFNIYHFNYIGAPQIYKGVMAQEVIKIRPDAVADLGGYLGVNYDKIGVNFEALEWH